MSLDQYITELAEQAANEVLSEIIFVHGTKIISSTEDLAQTLHDSHVFLRNR